MKANELRIGNLVNIKGHADEVGISAIGIDNFYKSKLEVEPIPLNEEWFLKFGFEKMTDKNKGWKQTSYSINNGQLIVCFDGGIMTVDFWNGLNKKYVHQLQNFYYALYGEELTEKQK